MATAYQGSIAHGGFHPIQGLGSWIGRCVSAVVERHRRAQEMADLAKFSDRDLWDLGLCRSDLMSVERGTYRRD